MIERLPFYMVYQSGMNMENSFPMWEHEEEERMSRRDYDYMKSAYPETAKRVMPYVEEECDRLEYSGSMMYDEYPDQLQLRLLCRRIYDKAKEEEKNPGKWLMDLVQVVTWQEILRRRSEHRSFRRKFY